MDLLEIFDNDFNNELDKFLENHTEDLLKTKEEVVLKTGKTYNGKKRGRKPKSQQDAVKDKQGTNTNNSSELKANSLIACIAGTLVFRNRMVFVDRSNRPVTIVTSKNYLKAKMAEDRHSGRVIEQSLVVCIIPNQNNLYYVPTTQKLNAMFSTMKTGVYACNLSNKNGTLNLKPLRRTDISIDKFIKQVDKATDWDFEVLEDIEFHSNK